ncbi:hypothetical protein GCM10029978_051190 [Actinoallomurus acanthiterrae]
MPVQTRRLRNFVNGTYVDAAEGRTTGLINPATGEVFAEAALSGRADVDAAFAAAAAAFENGWRDTTPAERQIALNKLADAIEGRADELVAAEVENCGKPVQATMSEEIFQVLDALRFFAGAARNLEGRAAGEYLADHTSWIRREPIGPVGQITPWNYPMAMAAWKIGPALAAGNTIVLKPSDTTPVSTLMIAEIAAEFLPPGVFNVITGDRGTGRTLVEHPTPRLISLTGSTRAGIEVARAGSQDLKRLHLELGGKAPVIVFDDADIDKAAEGIAGAATSTPGRTAPRRPACSPHPPFTKNWRRRSPRRPRRPSRQVRTTRPPTTARSTTRANWPGSTDSSTAPPTTRRSWREAPASATPATSSPRPSSPGSGRATNS